MSTTCTTASKLSLRCRSKRFCQYSQSIAVNQTRFAHNNTQSKTRWFNMDSNQLAMITDDIVPKYKKLLFEIDESKSSNLILWKGLKQLYCTKRLQNIEHFPSDLVWNHKTKNVYLLELDRAIKESKWREWLRVCYGVITPIYDPNEYADPRQKRKGGMLPPNPPTVIKSDAIKTLIPFLIKQTIKDNVELQKNILQKLTTEHSEKILTQFMDRIQRSDIAYVVYERNRVLRHHGNYPLSRFVKYDAEFTQIVNQKLQELSQVDRELADKFKECWTKTDHTFQQFTTPKKSDTAQALQKSDTHDVQRLCQHIEKLGKDMYSEHELDDILNSSATTGTHHESNHDEKESVMSDVLDILLWDDKQESLVSFNALNESEQLGEEEEEEVMTERDRLVYKSLQQFIEKVPAQYRAHHNLLRHTRDDCAKLAMLDGDLLREGYTGDNGHSKWGLWKANNLPIFAVRPHLLYLRDIISNRNLSGSYIEIRGKYGTGKSLALMYAVNIARKLKHGGEWICVYCPNAHEWVEKIKLTVPANDKDSVFYQHFYAREFFKRIKLSEGQKLRNIPLSNKYKFSYAPKSEDEKSSQSNIDLQTVYSMLEDPVDIKRYENDIINEWMTMGAPYTDEEGAFTLRNTANKFETLNDLVRFGISADCKSPASLLYDFMDEIKKQKVYKVLLACDNIDYWNNFMYGLSTPRNPKVFAWQLSMVDIFSQFQQINALPNGMVVMSRTCMGSSRRPQFKTHPSHIIECPDYYTNDEFDAVMWNYQGIQLCSPNVAPDDYLKVYAASARRPIYMQRLAALY